MLQKVLNPIMHTGTKAVRNAKAGYKIGSRDLNAAIGNKNATNYAMAGLATGGAGLGAYDAYGEGSGAVGMTTGAVGGALKTGLLAGGAMVGLGAGVKALNKRASFIGPRQSLKSRYFK